MDWVVDRGLSELKSEYLLWMLRWMKGRCMPMVVPTLVEALGGVMDTRWGWCNGGACRHSSESSGTAAGP